MTVRLLLDVGEDCLMEIEVNPLGQQWLKKAVPLD